MSIKTTKGGEQGDECNRFGLVRAYERRAYDLLEIRGQRERKKASKKKTASRGVGAREAAQTNISEVSLADQKGNCNEKYRNRSSYR